MPCCPIAISRHLPNHCWIIACCALCQREQRSCQRSGILGMTKINACRDNTMFIWSCNALSDKQIVAVLQGPHCLCPTVAQVYAGLGCRAKCGVCAHTIKKLRDQALNLGGGRQISVLAA